MKIDSIEQSLKTFGQKVMQLVSLFDQNPIETLHSEIRELKQQVEGLQMRVNGEDVRRRNNAA